MVPHLLNVCLHHGQRVPSYQRDFIIFKLLSLVLITGIQLAELIFCRQVVVNPRVQVVVLFLGNQQFQFFFFLEYGIFILLQLKFLGFIPFFKFFGLLLGVQQLGTETRFFLLQRFEFFDIQIINILNLVEFEG